MTKTIQIDYLIEGEGLPVMVIGSPTYYQRTFSKNLKRNIQLIYVNHRGFIPNEKITLQSYDRYYSRF